MSLSASVCLSVCLSLTCVINASMHASKDSNFTVHLCLPTIFLVAFRECFLSWTLFVAAGAVFLFFWFSCSLFLLLLIFIFFVFLFNFVVVAGFFVSVFSSFLSLALFEHANPTDRLYAWRFLKFFIKHLKTVNHTNRSLFLSSRLPPSPPSLSLPPPLRPFTPTSPSPSLELSTAVSFQGPQGWIPLARSNGWVFAYELILTWLAGKELPMALNHYRPAASPPVSSLGLPPPPCPSHRNSFPHLSFLAPHRPALSTQIGFHHSSIPPARGAFGSPATSTRGREHGHGRQRGVGNTDKDVNAGWGTRTRPSMWCREHGQGRQSGVGNTDMDVKSG